MPPSQPVKDFVEDFVKDLCKVFAVRSRRPKKNGPRQRNSTASDHAQIPSAFSFPSPTLSSNSSLVHSASSREPGLESSTNVPSSRHSGGVSLACEASDMAQIAFPLVQAVASAIPLIGAPMQAAIGGLLTGLQAIDRRNQNQADLNDLILRLDRLGRELCNALPALDPVEQSRRDSFVRMLQDTSTRVTKLRERCLASTPVTQAIAGRFVEIDRYLAEYLWSSQMQSQRDIREVLVILQREREDRQNFLMTIESLVTRGQSSVGPTATQLIGTATRGCVTLIDATGHQHPISVNFCTSFEQFNEMLKVLFKCNSIEARIQRRCMESGQYDLCIDKGTQVNRLTCNEWSRPEVGTKVVMRIIVQQQTTSSSGVSYKCPCGAVNPLGVGSIMYPLERQAGSSIDCRECGRRFQISRASPSAKRSTSTSTRSSSIDSDHATDLGMDLIRNFHIQQSEFPSLDDAFQCLWGNCNHIFFGYQIARHFREFHGIRGAENAFTNCPWDHCNRVIRMASLARHVIEAHLRIRYSCDTCSRIFSRKDMFHYHKKHCTGLQQ